MFPEIQNYKILKKIGSGGMGNVYTAFSIANKEKVAVKILNPEASEIPAVLEQFNQEASILKSLNHKNICGYRGNGIVQGCRYLAMELADGIGLDRVPKSASTSITLRLKEMLSVETYLKIFKSCFQALGYIHSKGLVHRDIKPSNIILRGEDYSDPCLIDFGIAKYVSADDDLNMNPENMYTVVYASPEQLTNKPADHLSDLFSLGVVMYEKLTGKLPFPGKKAMEVFVAQTKWNFLPPRQLNADVPQKLEDIILNLLQREPGSRYPNAEMVINDIDRVLEILRQCREGLVISPICDDIRGKEASKRGFKKQSIAEEKLQIKKVRAELVDARQRLRIEMSNSKSEAEKISSLRELCSMLKNEYETLNAQLNMALGFKNQPLVIDSMNKIFTMTMFSYEKRGIAFKINTIEQKVVSPYGEDIMVGSINFSEKAKKYYSVNKVNSGEAGWGDSNWYVGAYEEREFPVYIIVTDSEGVHLPPDCDCFVWSRDFLKIVKKFGWTGLGIVEKFRGVDRSGTTVYAEHKESVLFSQPLLDSI